MNKSKVDSIGSLQVSLNLFGTIPVKNMTVNVIPNTTVIPVGKAIGMKLYTDGILVVGMTEIEGKKPFENSGIMEGDRIIQINNKKVDSADELIEVVKQSKGNDLEITYKRDEETMETSIKPIKTRKQ